MSGVYYIINSKNLSVYIKILFAVIGQYGRCLRNAFNLSLIHILTASTLVVGAVSYGIIYKDVTHIGVISAGSGQMVVLTRGNKSVLIGCGGDTSAVYNLKDYMRRRGIREIDTVIIPELDEYFSSNAAEVMSQIDTNILISPPDNEGIQPLSALGIDGVEKIELTGNDRVDIFKNVYVICNAEANYTIVHAGDASVIIAGPGADTENNPCLLYTSRCV